jgi:hypothetical protein
MTRKLDFVIPSEPRSGDEESFRSLQTVMFRLALNDSSAFSVRVCGRPADDRLGMTRKLDFVIPSEPRSGDEESFRSLQIDMLSLDLKDSSAFSVRVCG